jgi:cytochrome P450
LVAALGRGLWWSRRATSRELDSWCDRAGVIPDSLIRADALEAIACKRDNVEGASLFSILPRDRDPHLLKLLVAYQIMWDFLDSASERGACAGQANGRQLHRALVEALDPEAPISNYYLYHPWKNDGGYLLALVETCRRMCAELPSYRQVRFLILQGVEGCAIQSLNHEPDPSRRDAALKAWAVREFSNERTLSWFELTAAAGAFMPHVLLALAAEPSCNQRELVDVYSAYFPWVSLTISMLDSYIDRANDVASGNHSYLSHYANETVAFDRLSAIIRQTVSRTARLPAGRRHAVLTSGIVAMYLSVESANTPELRAQTRKLAQAGGAVTRLLLPIAHIWRSTRARLSTLGDRGCNLPPALPLPTSILTYAYWRWPLTYMKLCQARYGECFTHRMTNFPLLVFLSNSADVKEMLTAPADVLHPGEGGVKIAPIVGESSFMLLDGDEHLSGRRAVLPAFHKRMIHKHADWVSEITQSAIASWPRDVAFPLHPRLRALTLEVILRRIFTLQGPECENQLRALREGVLAMLSVTGSVVFPEPILRHGPGRGIWERFLRQRSESDDLIYALIDERSEGKGAGNEDALAMLLEAHNADGSRMTRRQVRDNIMSLILAGHETTSSQLAWAFQLLAHNPVVQNRLIEEIDADAGDEYLTATIQEVLRHRPVFLFAIPRAVKGPIEIGGRTYKPPAHLLACIYLLHHDPEVYPEPEEFRPERFLEGQPSPHAWLPWGGGRKRCPGSHLAILEMKTVLRTVLRSVTVSPASRRMERPRWRSVIVTPHAGSRVVLRRRGNANLGRGLGAGVIG